MDFLLSLCKSHAPEVVEEEFGMSSLLRLADAAGRGDAAAVDEALHEGADANGLDYDLRSALHLAASSGSAKVVGLLLSARADANLEDRWGKTALDRAASVNAEAVQRVLRAAGGRPGHGDKVVSTPSNLSNVDTLTTTTASEGADALALCRAASANSLDKVQELYQSGAILDACDGRGRTALHSACKHGHVRIVRWLIDNEAEVSIRDRAGRTPALEAALNGHTEIVSMLQDAGARKGDMQILAELGQWAIPADEIELREELGTTTTSVVFGATWRGTKVVCKTTMGIPAGHPMSRERKLSEVSVASGTSGSARSAQKKELLHEIQVLSTLRHPDLVIFLGACLDLPQPLLISEFMEGGDLEHYYAAQSRGKGHHFQPSPSQLTHWAAAVARALAFLHGCSRPIVHRDLKPRSLLLNANRELKVTDFGISKLVEEQGMMMSTCSCVRACHYVAPEVFRQERYTDRVDVYSLGLVMWFMSTGRQPFAQEFGADDEELAQAFAGGAEPRPSLSAMRCPRELRELAAECWQAVPGRRPAAAECARRLMALSS